MIATIKDIEYLSFFLYKQAFYRLPRGNNQGSFHPSCPQKRVLFFVPTSTSCEGRCFILTRARTSLQKQVFYSSAA